MDTALFYFIDHLPHFHWLDVLVTAVAGIQQKEAGLVMACVLLYGVISKNSRLWQAALILIAAFFLVDQIVWFLKPLVNRPRPAQVLSDVVILGAKSGGSSFPSSNAANVSVIFAYIYFVTKKKPVLWAGLIVVLGIFRVYQGIHFPSDVLGGWVVGALIAWPAAVIYRYVRERFRVKPAS